MFINQKLTLDEQRRPQTVQILTNKCLFLALPPPNGAQMTRRMALTQSSMSVWEFAMSRTDSWLMGVRSFSPVPPEEHRPEGKRLHLPCFTLTATSVSHQTFLHLFFSNRIISGTTWDVEILTVDLDDSNQKFKIFHNDMKKSNSNNP